MIVVDSSALVAILDKEPEGPSFVAAISDTPRCLISAVAIYEAGVVMQARHGREGVEDLMALLEELAMKTVPFAEPYISAALAAYARYGKGIHPQARLNLCDCVSYALAKAMDAPLLFKGG